MISNRYQIFIKKTLESNMSLDFYDAKGIFNGYTLTVEDDRFDYPERRFVTLGLILEHVIAVVHTESEEKLRIISARKAPKNEQKEYFKQVSY
jgi:uncharacterized DUF497 family protein